MHAVLGAQLRKRQLAPDCLECYFRFEFSAITVACRLGHLCSSFPKDEPSLSSCPIRGDPLSLSAESPTRTKCVRTCPVSSGLVARSISRPAKRPLGRGAQPRSPQLP